MRQMALLREAGRQTVVEYWTDDGFHQLLSNGRPYVTGESPEIEPMVLNDIGDLVPEPSNRLLRRYVEQEAGAIRAHGVALRHFEISDGVMSEVPVAAMAEGWRKMTSTVRSQTLEYNSKGAVVPVEGGAAVALEDLRRKGMALVVAQTLVMWVASCVALAHANRFAAKEILDRFKPRLSHPMDMAPMILVSVVATLELATGTPIGAIYESQENRSLVLLGAIAFWGVWKLIESIFVRRTA